MTKNKLEKLFSKSKYYFDWCIKLHNNPLSHQTTPADYIASHTTKKSVIPSQNYNKVILFECKQVTCKDGKGRLAFKRLKQLHDLLAFEHIKDEHESNFVIAFWDKNWAKSDIYLVPVKTMKFIMDNINKVSINREEAAEQFEHLKLEVEKGELKWNEIF